MNSFENLLLEAASFTPRSLQEPNAWCGHLPFAAWLMRTVKPKMFVELGTHTGNSYFSFCQSATEANSSIRCYAIDTWQGDEHAGTYGNEVFDQVNEHNQTYYANFSRLLRMTFDEAVDYFTDGSIDLLHIDGLHTYEAVKHDFDTWLPKLAPGAVVLFHDTNVRERGFGVWKFWEELQARYPANMEFFHSNGLGVLQIDGASDQQKLAWLDADSGQQQLLKDYFGTLGGRQLDRFELGQAKNHAANLAHILADREGQISQHADALEAYQQQAQVFTQNVAVLQHDVAQRDEQIAHQLAELERYRAQAQQFTEQVNALQAELAETASHRDTLMAEKESSTSLEATKPSVTGTSGKD